MLTYAFLVLELSWGGGVVWCGVVLRACLVFYKRRHNEGARSNGAWATKTPLFAGDNCNNYTIAGMSNSSKQ